MEFWSVEFWLLYESPGDTQVETDLNAVINIGWVILPLNNAPYLTVGSQIADL